MGRVIASGNGRGGVDAILAVGSVVVRSQEEVV